MRKLLLLLAACLTGAPVLAQTADSTEALEPAPYRLRFQSYEAASASGTLALLPAVNVARPDTVNSAYLRPLRLLLLGFISSPSLLLS